MEVTILSNIAMALLAIGTIPSIYTAIKHRNRLKGFSFWGALILVIAQMLFLFFFFLIGDYVTSATSTIPTSYWWFVVFYTGKEKLKK